ncbi:hypothetical protein CKQ70_30530 [Bacillus toyonensis]|nr:hypothetical protein CKQ70_30530 [Bacillus toyonensis]PAW43712.1 hypothetical protein CKQ69_30905 [Bacillus toyonensis]
MAKTVTTPKPRQVTASHGKERQASLKGFKKMVYILQVLDDPLPAPLPPCGGGAKIKIIN